MSRATRRRALWAAAFLVVAAVGDAAARGGRGGGGRMGGGGFQRGGVAAGGSFGQRRSAGGFGSGGPAASGTFAGRQQAGGYDGGAELPDRGDLGERREQFQQNAAERQEARDAAREARQGYATDRREDWQEYAEDHYDDRGHGYYDDIPSFTGSARLGSGGEVVESQRTESQWTWVKYAYRDARRYGALHGLTVRGTIKIWDTDLAGLGMLWAKRHGDAVLRRYTERVYERFWKRDLDVEDLAVLEAVLAEAGADPRGFGATTTGEALARYRQFQRDVFDAGIFGVPGYVVEGEYYWGREHLPRIAWTLKGRRGPAPDVAYQAIAETLAR